MAFRDSINDLMYRFYERFKQNNNRLPVSVEADINVGDVQIGTVKQGAKDDGAEPWDVALQGMDDPEDPVGGTLLGRLSALEEKMDALLSDGLQLQGRIVDDAANRPAADSVDKGTVFWAVDTGEVSVSTGTEWRSLGVA